MNKKSNLIILREARKYVKKSLEKDTTGHDFFHTLRVVKNSLKIAKIEGGNLFIIELAALFHDIADWKFNNGDITLSAKYAKAFLKTYEIDPTIIKHICDIISNISFKGNLVKDKMKTIEGKIVQDADRLDAIGAIGIARAFAYGGKMNRPIFDPSKKSVNHKTFLEYKSSNSHTINHFYEKLLLIKDRINTKTGKQIAEKRHEIIKNFMKDFFIEWEGIDIL